MGGLTHGLHTQLQVPVQHRVRVQRIPQTVHPQASRRQGRHLTDERESTTAPPLTRSPQPLPRVTPKCATCSREHIENRMETVMPGPCPLGAATQETHESARCRDRGNCAGPGCRVRRAKRVDPLPESDD